MATEPKKPTPGAAALIPEPDNYAAQGKPGADDAADAALVAAKAAPSPEPPRVAPGPVEAAAPPARPIEPTATTPPRVTRDVPSGMLRCKVHAHGSLIHDGQEYAPGQEILVGAKAVAALPPGTLVPIE